MAAHSGCECVDDLDRRAVRARRSAAEPAVEPTSIALARSASLALFEPADLTQLTVMPWSSSSASSQPFC